MSFVSDALTYGLDQTRRNLAELTSFPEVAQNGRWLCVDNGGWVGGHWAGLLWLAYAHADDPALLAAARVWTERLNPRREDTTTHDLGFLFLPHILGHFLTGDTRFQDAAVQAAQTLTRRFNPRGNFIQAWGPLDGTPAQRGRIIIDTMMNLDLLFRASEVTGDRRYAAIADAHARTALARLVRSDYSTAHVGDFDPETGAFIKQDTHQGMSPTSCWSRGQSWAAYGFAACYRWTGSTQYLDTARRLTQYALRRLPADRVPLWDYDAPDNDVRDSSAASILASGLLFLATLEPDAALAKAWRDEGTAILQSLWTTYSSRGTPEKSILIHATRSKPHGSADHGLIYGDYYFVEGLTRLTKPDKLPF